MATRSQKAAFAGAQGHSGEDLCGYSRIHHLHVRPEMPCPGGQVMRAWVSRKTHFASGVP